MNLARNSTMIVAIGVVSFWVLFPIELRKQVASPVGFNDESIVNPATYSSDSKSFQLSVNPTDRNGRGGATYDMTRNGERVWASELPFTLLDVVVTDSGEVVGYSYSHGVEGFSQGQGVGDFRVAILGPNGAPKLNEAHVRQSSDFLHTAPNPISIGFVVDEEHDRVIFRIADPDVNRRSESWWIYELSTGRSVDRVKPRERLKDSEYLSYLIDARAVAGTPLILLHWWRFQYPDPTGQLRLIIGGRFVLVDEKADPVWELEVPRDYVIPGDEEAQDRLMAHVQRHGAILNTGEQSSFDVYLASDAQRATFSVAGGPGAWVVNEASRHPLEFSELLESSAEVEDIPLTPLRSLGQSPLETTRDKSPIRQLSDFTFDQIGRIGFIRQQNSNPDAFVLVDESGKVLCEIALTIAADENSRWTSCSWISGDRFLLTRAEYGIEKLSRAWWVDVAERTISPVVDFDSPPVERLLRFSDGGFVALATIRNKYTMVDGLYGFDNTGRSIWQVVTDSSDGPTELFSPEDIAVTTDDQVAVLDNIRNTIQLFTRSGEFVRKINLEQTLGKEPSYLAGISAIRNGFVIHDFDGSPTYIVTDENGRAMNRFTPKLGNGRLLAESYFSIAPDGTMWATDGDAVFRLNKDAMADRVLGHSPETDQLTIIAGSAVDPRGQVYLVDGRTAKVHIYDLSGAARGLCIPDPEDFVAKQFDTSISVSDSGEVSVGVDRFGDAGRFVQFASTGKRMGSVQLKQNARNWSYQPGTKNTLALTYDTILFLDSNREVIQEISRRPDGNWLTWPARACFALDGSLAVLDSRSVNIYQADGTPVRTIELPTLVGNFPRIAYNSNRVVVSGEGHIVFYDVNGELLKASKSGLEDKDFQPHIIANGQELLIIPNHASTLYRFAMP